MSHFSPERSQYFNELEDRDQLFKIYYSEQLKKRLQIKNDCDAITFKGVNNKLHFYQQKRRYWTQGNSQGITPLQPEAALFNKVFLSPEQLQQAERQIKYNEVWSRIQNQSDYKPSVYKTGQFRRWARKPEQASVAFSQTK